MQDQSLDKNNLNSKLFRKDIPRMHNLQRLSKTGIPKTRMPKSDFLHYHQNYNEQYNFMTVDVIFIFFKLC